MTLTVSAVCLLACKPGNEEACYDDDYECNMKAFQAEINRKPPNFIRAEKLALPVESTFMKNIQYVNKLPDYEATAMLLVLKSYRLQWKDRICEFERDKGLFSNRRDRMKSVYQRGEFEQIWSEIQCGGLRRPRH